MLRQPVRLSPAWWYARVQDVSSQPCAVASSRPARVHQAAHQRNDTVRAVITVCVVRPPTRCSDTTTAMPNHGTFAVQPPNAQPTCGAPTALTRADSSPARLLPDAIPPSIFAIIFHDVDIIIIDSAEDIDSCRRFGFSILFRCPTPPLRRQILLSQSVQRHLRHFPFPSLSFAHADRDATLARCAMPRHA